jgi:hypothetical protein
MFGSLAVFGCLLQSGYLVPLLPIFFGFNSAETARVSWLGSRELTLLLLNALSLHQHSESERKFKSSELFGSDPLDAHRYAPISSQVSVFDYFFL